MKLIEVVLLSAILVLFLRIFTAVGMQINYYRTETLVYMEKTQEVLQNKVYRMQQKEGVFNEK